jgi:1-acyl-sn-glycerol-3-phosphate acyltransferase
VIDSASWLALRALARLAVSRRVRLTVEGLEHVPADGPLLIASRHYHHLLDALVLLTAVPRPAHFLVALDWVDGPAGRRLMETACRAARWPVILRAGELERPGGGGGGGGRRPAYAPAEAPRYLRRGLRDAQALLRAGRALIVFPEGYPRIDPARPGRPAPGDALLPFAPGAVRLAALAGGGGAEVPLVPAGLAYRLLGGPPAGGATWLRGRWEVTLRFGPALAPGAGGRAATGEAVARLAAAVGDLSRPAPGGDYARSLVTR